MRDAHPKAKRRRKRLAREAAEQFDETLAHNLVWDTVQEATRADRQLLDVLDTIERARNLAEGREERTDRDDATYRALFSTGEVLDERVDDLVDELVAEASGDVLDVGDEWLDHWTQSEIDAAQAEAREWLAAHPEAAERAGVDVPEEATADA